MSGEAKCLVVEESPVIREIAVRILKDAGLNPIECEDASGAVRYCRDNDPAVVFLDWDLPSKGALEFLQAMQAKPADKRAQVVICATENDTQQFSAAKAAGAAGHLLKPYDKGAMLAKLGEIGVIKSAA